MIVRVDDTQNWAGASSEGWRTGRQLSSIDGMPVSITDLIETADMPTKMVRDACKGNSAGNDNPLVWALRQERVYIVMRPLTLVRSESSASGLYSGLPLRLYRLIQILFPKPSSLAVRISW